MFRNYFRTAHRNLVRNKNFSLINIIGLAIGLAVCISIFLIIQYQTSFDEFHTKKDRVYRVLTEFPSTDANNISRSKDVPFPLPAGLSTSFPQIEQIAPIFASHDDVLLIPEDKGTNTRAFKEEKGVFFSTASFFTLFDFPLLTGSYESLNQPNNVLLTKEIADRYFGDWKLAMGKTLKLEMGGYLFEHGTDLLTVTGILETIPVNTDFQIKLMVSYGTGATGSVMATNKDWADKTNAGFGCFVLLPANRSLNQFNQELKSYSQKLTSPRNKDSYALQALGEIHYDTVAGNYSNKTINKKLLNALWLIAGFILLIACVNFINLSTAQAVNRAKEIGVRKVLGGKRSQLQIQFILEAFLIVGIAVSIAFAITVLALPSIRKLLELSISFDLLFGPELILFLIIITLLVTFLAGFYPSLVLSNFNPVNALKSKFTISSAKGLSLRRGLVVFQFIVAQALIIGTFVIVKQMNYFTHQELGFDKEAIINVPFRVDSVRISRLGYLRDQLMQIKGVNEVSYSSNTPVEDLSNMWSSLKFNRSSKEESFKAITKFADEKYLSTYKLPLLAGRNLEPSGFTREFLINESLMKSLGITKPEDILNKEISIWDDRIKCPVVGVLKDFNDRSSRDETAPLLISTNVTMYNQAAIKLETANISAVLQSVQQAWEKSFPNLVYEYRFLDEKIESFYKQEYQLAQLYQLFAAIAILLSCLGLYGLASFMAVQRVKEVGIRKVLGASASNIVYLFSREFILLIILAFIIASPIAWYFMNQWLQDYAYRINISWWLFLGAGLAALLVALATISFQAIKAAIAKPIKSLRSE